MAKIKEKDYFDMFVTSVEYSCRISHNLNEFLNGLDKIDDLEKAVWDIHSLEHEADNHFHGIYRQLNQSFITPIEREDILTLAQAIDDFTDAIEDVAFSVSYLNLKKLTPDVFKFAGLIEKSSQELKVAITEFKKFKKSKVLSDQINKVNSVEEEGDRLYYKMLRELFLNNPDPLETIKWREVYEKLENCLDACENVADILDGIVLKNS